MKVYLLRHGETEYNMQKRYQGTLDIPLSDKGLGELMRADLSPETVYVTPLCRTRQTARVLFPDARLIPVPGLREMDFGDFEGHSCMEMADDPDYRAWVDSGCLGRIPGGEEKQEFCDRVCAAFAPLVDRALADGEENLVVLAHGGTLMAAMERYTLPYKKYFEWVAPNAGGFVLDASRWRPERILTLVETVCYTKRKTP